MSAPGPFSLDRFEFLVYRGKHEEAATELVSLLAHLDTHHGGLSDLGSTHSGDLGAEMRDAYFGTRIATAIAALFSQPGFRLSMGGFKRLIPLQRWFAIVFGASPLGNADHVIRLFNEQGYANPTQITLTDQNLVKFALLYSPDSEIPIQPETLWENDPRFAAAVFFALLSARVVATPQAQAKREHLLQWLPQRLNGISLDDIPLAIVHDVWMHCSYAFGSGKHRIKQSINEMVRVKLNTLGFTDMPAALRGPAVKRDKPVLLCVLEWFQSTHAMFRCYSTAIQALKTRFKVIGISLREASDAAARGVFDELHVLPVSASIFDNVKSVCDLAAKENPDLIYYPSIGMFPDTVFLSNLRLSPLQITSLGHPATTCSPEIDYAVVEDDCLGDPACFTEKLLVIPHGAIPYVPPMGCPAIRPQVRRDPDPVRIGIPAAVMKINAVFLDTLRRISEQARVAVEFHMFAGSARGLTKVYLANLARRALGERAVVYPHLPYSQYLENINRCHMFVNPFPFGNTNDIVDTVRQGLPGVCLTGAEVHSHIDEGIFRRLGLPEWTIARTIDEYVRAALRLAEDSQEREAIAHMLLQGDPVASLFRGEPHTFANAIAWLHAQHERLLSDNAQVVRAPGSSYS